MWKKKLNYRKGQYCLVGLTLLITAFIFTMCLSFTLELTRFAQSVFTDENSADTYLVSIGSDELERNLSNTSSANIKAISALKGKAISIPIKHGEKDISQYNQLLLTLEQFGSRNLISSVNSENETLKIGSGEVWIANTLAIPNKIELGDILVVEDTTPVKLTVTGIYSSVFSTSPALCFAPVIVSNEDISLFDSNIPGAVFALDLYDSSKEKLDEIAHNYEYTSMTLTRDMLRSSVSEVSSVVSMIGAIASLIIFALALSIINFIIKKCLEKEYKAIGIYKSLGYDTSSIIGFYRTGYLVVGFVSIAAGTLLSLPFSYLLGRISTKYVDGFTLTSLSVFICLSVTALFLLFLYFNLRKTLKRVKYITPIEAIQSGDMHSKKKIASPIIEYAKSPFSVALNEWNRHRTSAIMTILVLFIASYLSMMFVTIGYSSFMMNKNANLWFAVPKNNSYVSGDVTESVSSWMNQNKNIKQHICGDLFYFAPIKGEDYTDEFDDVSFDIFSNTDPKLTEVSISGEHPEKANEIAITTALLNRINKNVGDTVRLTIYDKLQTYSIVGSYNSMLNNYGIMMTTREFQTINPQYIPSRCFVTLNDTESYTKFKEDAETNFGNITVNKEWSALENSISSTRSMLVSVSGILLIVFLLFAIFNIVIVLLMDIGDSRRENGILKALGFTNRYLIIKNLVKYVSVGIVSIILSLSVHLAFTRKMLSSAFIDAFRDSYCLLSCLIVGIIIIIALTAFIISCSIRTISPIELMEE